MRFDLHVHSAISPCSRLQPDEIIATAGQRGLAGICITDHDTMAVRNYLREGIQENGLCVIFGMEYTTSQGDFLLFGPFEGLRPGLDATEILCHVEAVGGVAVAAHPFRKNRATAECLIDMGLCGIVEGINGRNQPNENHSVSLWTKRYGVKTVGGSDAHTPMEIGRMVTRFSSAIQSRNQLIAALKGDDFSPEARFTQ